MNVNFHCYWFFYALNCAGKFFEILIGRGTEPLWTLLSKIAVLYILEPIFTVIYVINITTIWEKVMTSLRGHIFRRMLIQKVLIIFKYLQVPPYGGWGLTMSACSMFLFSIICLGCARVRPSVRPNKYEHSCMILD